MTPRQARALALVLPVLGALYACDATWWGLTGWGYARTVMDDRQLLQALREGNGERARQAVELEERLKVVDRRRREVVALERAAALRKR